MNCIKKNAVKKNKKKQTKNKNNLSMLHTVFTPVQVEKKYW